jgi:fatty-acid desaturase
MRPPVFRVHGEGASASAGRVVWSPLKTLWIGSFIAAALAFAPATASVAAVTMFALLTYTTLLLGHSVGMHRCFIHRSVDCAKPVERVLVYAGVLVGMAGPLGILRIHDIRDWAQRERACHDFFAHRKPLWLDALWQLTCRFEFERPPRVEIEAQVLGDPWYRWMERTWMLQQLVPAAILYAIGGWPWVVWGVFVRVPVSVTGHWIVTYLTHDPGAPTLASLAAPRGGWSALGAARRRTGAGRWRVPDAGVQASNLAGCGFITMGECWHNNHHAFPESARMGLHRAEFDPGWWVIRALAHMGLVTRAGLPRDERLREDLEHVESISTRHMKTDTRLS